MVSLYLPPTQNSVQYTLDAQYTAGANTLTLNCTLTGIIEAPGVCVIDRVDTSGNKTPTKRDYFTFTGVSGVQLTGVSGGKAGSTNQDHAVGAVVEFIPDVVQAQAVYDVFTTEHTINGVHASLPSLTYIQTKNLLAASQASLTTVDVALRFSASGASITGFYPSGASGLFYQSQGPTAAPIWGTPIANIASGASIYLSGVQTMQAVLPSQASTTIPEFGIQNASGHLIIKPGASKLVAVSVLRQDDTSNTYSNNNVILTGWGYVNNAAGDRINEAVTFGLTFSAVPVVVLGALGKTTATVSAISSFDDVNNLSKYISA